MFALTEEEISAGKEAVSTYPGTVNPFPKKALDRMFAEFTEEQVKRILFEFSKLLVTAGKVCFQRYIELESIPGMEKEADRCADIAEYLSGFGVGLLDVAVN